MLRILPYMWKNDAMVFIELILTIYNRCATSDRYIFHIRPQKLRKIIRRSTGQ
jgi:hypothetical protein